MRLLLAACLVLTGCSTERRNSDFFAPTDVGVLVVQAMLIVDQPLPVIDLTRTVSPDLPYRRSAAGVSDATVTILLDPPVPYREDPLLAGRYIPPAGAPIVLPGVRYALQITTIEGEQLTAETTTPARFRVSNWVIKDAAGRRTLRTLRTFSEAGAGIYDENRIVYQQGLLDALVQPASVPAYQVGLFSLDLDSPIVIDADFLSDEDLADLDRIGSSPPLAAPDNFIRLPWFAIFFEGRYLIKVHALDRNWYDLIRSTPAFGGNQGFGGNIGDNVDRPIFHVEGGIGLFGSAAVDSIGVTILPRE